MAKHALTAILIFVSAFPATARAAISEREFKTLLIFFEDKVVVSATRYEKRASKTAENVVVVTAEEIERMNAHTLADVLNTVPGVQVAEVGGLGIPPTYGILGSETRHVLVLIDGVDVRTLSDGVADTGAIPVQNIERIEIIKGPASSTWGSSLGGVIDIITKTPGETADGMFSASYGERDTSDLRAEASGRRGRVGYYLNANSLHTNGFSPGRQYSNNTFYGKLGVELSSDTDLRASLSYGDGDRGFGEFEALGLAALNYFEHVFSSVTLGTRLSKDSELSFSARALSQDISTELSALGTADLLATSSFGDDLYGASAKFVHRAGAHSLVAGADYEYSTLRAETIEDGKKSLEKWAVFLNDSVDMDGWALTPGLRYDYTSTNGEFLSPSLGLTYSPARGWTIRAYVARGFNIPTLGFTFASSTFFVPNPGLDMEKVWSYQAGVETSALGPLKLKANVFRHDVEDAITPEPMGKQFTYVNRDEVRRQGFEVVAGASPMRDMTVTIGYVFVDAEDQRTGETIRNVPRYTWDVALAYVLDGFKADLRGRYIWWNTEKDLQARYDDFLWDASVMKTLYKESLYKVEGFVTAHNILNGARYNDGRFQNPSRWVEAGLRLRY
ncbi:MAG: TonB-dependent receptor [Thermodesulfovibrionales bacterium]